MLRWEETFVTVTLFSLQRLNLNVTAFISILTAVLILIVFDVLCPEPPKDYIHVRARRGQATDSHSLAERVRINDYFAVSP